TGDVAEPATDLGGSLAVLVADVIQLLVFGADLAGDEAGASVGGEMGGPGVVPAEGSERMQGLLLGKGGRDGSTRPGQARFARKIDETGPTTAITSRRRATRKGPTWRTAQRIR